MTQSTSSPDLPGQQGHGRRGAEVADGAPAGCRGALPGSWDNGSGYGEAEEEPGRPSGHLCDLGSDSIVVAIGTWIMTSVLLYSIDPSENRRRFYAMSVDKDLFGVATITVHWGRIGRRGSFRILCSGERTEMLREMRRLANLRTRRRYTPLP